MSTVVERLLESFELCGDLAESLGAEDLSSKLPVPSNTIWLQLWCVVGARESYGKAIASGEWQGFSCSLTSEDNPHPQPLVDALKASARSAGAAATSNPDSRFVLDLLLHETQHQGQLIRYLFGLDLEVPDSWKRRWAL